MATKTGRVGAKKLKELEQEAQSDNKPALYVRISQETKDILERIVKEGWTNANVIEALLENYTKQNSETQLKILKRQSVNPLKEYDDLLALLHWAQHAFEHKRYILAAKLYMEIADNLHSSKGFTDFCNYKLGICWIRLSYELRMEALKTGDYEYYDLAQETLLDALTYTKKVEGNLGGVLSKLIKYYNLACCHSLRAQYLVEARMCQSNSELAAELLTAGHGTPAMEKVWQHLGKSWREKYKGKGRGVDVEAQDAFDQLQEIYSTAAPENSITTVETAGDSDLLAERIWLATAALRDDDLTFLRFDEQRWQPELKKWSDSVLQGTKFSIADTIDALLRESRSRLARTSLNSHSKS